MAKNSDKSSLLFYRSVKWLVVWPLFKFFFRGRFKHRDRLPETQRAIVVSSHASNLDPPFLGVCLSFPVAFMAKEELFEVPVLKTVIQWLGGYPVDRQSPDRSTIRAALDALDRGWSVGIFPEGTRTEDGRIHNAKLGAALIAYKAGVPLIPVCIWNNHRIHEKRPWWPPLPITVRVGETIAPPQSSDRAELEAVMQRCTETINALHDLGR